MLNTKRVVRFVKLVSLLILISYNGYSQKINPGVVISFDDYAIANWHKLIPLFKKYDAKATFYVCYPYLFDSSKQSMLSDLYINGHEIGSHGYNHKNSLEYIASNGIEAWLTNEIFPSIHWFDSVLNIKTESFSYPYGSRSNESDTALLKYFKTIRGTNYAMSSAQNKISNLSHSGLINGVGIDDAYGFTFDQIKTEINRCKKDSLIQIFYSHTPVDSNPVNYQITYALLDSILNYIHQSGLAFYTASQVWVPIPEQPNGDTLIYTSNTAISDYAVSLSGYATVWRLEPQECGSLTFKNNESKIEWNPNFSGTAYLSVSAMNECGIGQYSKPLSIQINSINQVPMVENPVCIFPNPSNGDVNISLVNNGSRKQIEIYNTVGQILWLTQTTESHLYIKALPKGTYITKVTDGGQVFTYKLIIE